MTSTGSSDRAPDPEIKLDRFGFPVSWSIQTRRELRRVDEQFAGLSGSLRARREQAVHAADQAVTEPLSASSEDLSGPALRGRRVVVALPFPIQTGGMRVQMQLAGMLAEAGAEVHVCQVRGNDCLDDAYEPLGLASREAVGDPRRLTAALRDLGPAAVLAGCWIDYARAFDAGVGPVLGYSAGEPTLKEEAPFDKRLLNFAQQAHHLPVTLLAGSKFIQNVYRERFGRASLFLSVPISSAMFDHKHLAPAEYPYRIVLVGPEHLTTKGIPWALRALQSLRSEGANIVWVSPVTPSDEMAAMVDEIHVGLDAPAVADAIASCHVLVFPSRIEGLGNPPLEAMALGVPAVLCPNGGSEEYAEDGVNCLQGPYGDAEALQMAVKRLRNDKGLVDRLRAHGYTTAERYRPATVARKLGAFLVGRIDQLPSAAELQTDDAS